MTKYRWGIIAPGNISRSFATALMATDSAQCNAVASRSQQRADSFASEFGFAKSYGNYQQLIDDSQVDIVYIGSPHHLHHSQSLACLNAGKSVLCEKPMTVNAIQANEVIKAAQSNRCFYMEAVWTRFLPVYQHIRRWLDEGAIGDIKMVQASFGFNFDFDPHHRLYDVNLAGGALLDMGIYPITLSQWVYQMSPSEIRAVGYLGSSGVDEQVAIALQYANGAVSHLGTCTTANTPHDAWIIGSNGKIQIHSQFWGSEAATLYADADTNKLGTTINCPHRVNGYEWEIDAVHQSLDAEQIQNPLMNWQTSLSVIEIMDEIRTQIGLRYPFEAAVSEF